jgi:C4-dicarboxylate transporter DctM subunit
VATQIGIDPVQLGVVLTVNMAVGLITPPVGINLYVGCSITNMPVAQLCKKIVPFVVAGVVVILLTTFISPLSMFLPGLMK